MKKDDLNLSVLTFIDALRQALASIYGSMNDEIDRNILGAAEQGLTVIDLAIIFMGEDSAEAVIMQMAKIDLRMDIIKARREGL